jgi:hypothetical protein
VVEPSTAQLGPGQIRDCNRSLLAASASQAGAQVTDLGILRDTLGSVEAGLQKAIAIGGGRGAWCLVPGAWCLVPGAWCLVH